MAVKGPDHPRLPVSYPATMDEIVTAQQDGAAAAAAGLHVGSCPYRATEQLTQAESDRIRFLRVVWARAYRHVQAERRQER